MRTVIKEMTSNQAVDFNISTSQIGAAIDRSSEDDDTDSIRSYDLQGLGQYEQRYEALYVMHANLVGADQMLLELVNEILSQIDPKAR